MNYSSFSFESKCEYAKWETGVVSTNPLHFSVKDLIYLFTMVSVTKIFTCRVCGSNNLIKKGFEKNGNSRVKCKDCNSIRVAELKPIYTEERKAEIIKAYQERASLRGVSRIYGVAKQTLSDWIKKNS